MLSANGKIQDIFIEQITVPNSCKVKILDCVIKIRDTSIGKISSVFPVAKVNKTTINEMSVVAYIFCLFSKPRVYKCVNK